MIMKHTIYVEDDYGHQIYKAGGKVLSDIKAVTIDDVLYSVTSRVVEVSVSEMGHHNKFNAKRYFIKYKNKKVDLFDFCWFDPEDEWFADEGPAEYEVLAVDVES
jgi:hypothetical protein